MNLLKYLLEGYLPKLPHMRLNLLYSGYLLGIWFGKNTSFVTAVFICIVTKFDTPASERNIVKRVNSKNLSEANIFDDDTRVPRVTEIGEYTSQLIEHQK